MLASQLLAILPLLSTALALSNLRIRDHGTTGGSDAVPSGIPGSIAPAVPEGDKPLDVVALYGAELEAMAPAAEAPPAHEAPAEGGEAPSATTILHTTTYTGASPYYTPQYGSGAWQSGGDLNSCLSICHAQFGGGGGEAAPPAAGGEAKPPAEGGAPAEGGKPPGTPTEGGAPAATHTIIVAPTMGVLRYVPFAVTAAEGDTLHFIWGAGPHSVTLSDGNNVCNKSTTALAFDSGKLNATQTFETVVKNNASTPQFHYCTVGPHCSKGMFGLINPPTTNISNELTDKATKSLTAPKEESTSGGGQSIGCSDDTVACWAEKWGNTGNSKPEAKAVYQGVKQKCQSVPAAWEWGSKWDFSKHTSTVITKEVIIENIMYSRLMFASNPSMLDKSKPYPTNYISPPELNSFIAAAGNSTSGAGAASAPAGPESPSPTVDSEAANATTTTGAAGRSLGLSPAVLVALAGLSISIFI